MDEPPERDRPSAGAYATPKVRVRASSERLGLTHFLLSDLLWAVAALAILGTLASTNPLSLGAPYAQGVPGTAARMAPTAGTILVLGLFLAFLWRTSRSIQGGASRVRHLYPFLLFVLSMHAILGRVTASLAASVAPSLAWPFDRADLLVALIPAAAGAVLVSLLTSERLAVAYGFFATAVLTISLGWTVPFMVYTLLTHLAGAHGASHYRTRTGQLRAGAFVGLVGAACILGLDALGPEEIPWQVRLAKAFLALCGGLLGVPLIVSFLLPISERLFGALTDIRLLELSNLNNPLLSQLALRAPGSYNHSIVVGTLAESAAEAIGAHKLLCRVASYYHDIGKMKMPEYYIENQKPGENPHDHLTPSMSALILTNHVKEGLKLGREHGLPEPILDIIPQHHGTRVMTYFYEKAKAAAAASGAPLPNPDDFRHPGPKPSSREAAIFMLADSVEAAARTVVEPGEERFRELIRQIASRIILDGQFDHCDLTFHDLDTITEAFVRTLMSVYHHRIDYPTFIFEGRAARKTARTQPEREP